MALDIGMLIYGAVVGAAFLVVGRFLGIKLRPWPRALVSAGLGLLVAVALRYGGVEVFFAILIGFVLVPSAVDLVWKSLERRQPELRERQRI